MRMLMFLILLVICAVVLPNMIVTFRDFAADFKEIVKGGEDDENE